MRWNQVLLAATIVVVSLTGQAVMKRGLVEVRAAAAARAEGVAGVVPRALRNPRVLIGFATLCLSAAAYLALLYTTEISRLFPIMGAFGYIYLALIAFLWLGEPITLGRCLGLACLIAGILLLSRS